MTHSVWKWLKMSQKWDLSLVFNHCVTRISYFGLVVAPVMKWFAKWWPKVRIWSEPFCLLRSTEGYFIGKPVFASIVGMYQTIKKKRKVARFFSHCIHFSSLCLMMEVFQRVFDVCWVIENPRDRPIFLEYHEERKRETSNQPFNQRFLIVSKDLPYSKVVHANPRKSGPINSNTKITSSLAIFGPENLDFPKTIFSVQSVYLQIPSFGGLLCKWIFVFLISFAHLSPALRSSEVARVEVNLLCYRLNCDYVAMLWVQYDPPSLFSLLCHYVV